MNTSKYDADTRYNIKRDLRTKEIIEILDKGRASRNELEGILKKRNDEIKDLRKIVQGQIDNGAWNESWESLGFKKKA